jgi:hypothetical protein
MVLTITLLHAVFMLIFFPAASPFHALEKATVMQVSVAISCLLTL